MQCFVHSKKTFNLPSYSQHVDTAYTLPRVTLCEHVNSLGRQTHNFKVCDLLCNSGDRRSSLMGSRHGGPVSNINRQNNGLFR